GIKHFGKINTDCSRKHGDLQPTDAIGQLRAQNRFGYDHWMIFRPWRRDNQVPHDAFAIGLLDCILGVLANGENWRFGWLQFLISDLKKNVAWTQTCSVRWAALMNVLKHPALFPIQFVPHEGRGDGVAAGDLRTLRVAKTGVAGLQFGQQILYLFLEFFITGAL